ncbi:MAG TPA: ATP-binding protein [Geothrix sp.]|nr:ATP-binding protein [Geothrix sp.]
MLQRTLVRMGSSDLNAPFLPLSFRLFASFGLLVLHLALPTEGVPGPGEGLYMLALAVLLVESAWECGRGLRGMGLLFPTPRLAWIRWNLALDLVLVTLVIAFQGVSQERFSTFYIFPVLASAFYLGTIEIVWVGILSSLTHLSLVLAFATGFLPRFGGSVQFHDADLTRFPQLLGVASLQVFTTTLVVVLIRRNLERLHSDLSDSEAAVGEISALHQRVVDSLASGLITLDPTGRATSANPAAEEILGRPIPPGATLREILPLGDVLPVHRGREHRFERPFLHPVLGRRILGGHLASLRGASGRESGLLLLFQDLTELKELEERTRISERLAAIGQLAAGLAHELRNPLASISGCVQILQNGETAQDVHPRVLGILDRETQRVNAIVTDFLDFARQAPPESKRLFLPRVIEEVRSSWEMDPRVGGLTLRVSEVPEIEIDSDPVGLHRVLMNLLSNARKAVNETPEPSVTLDVRCSADRVAITVSDNGCGMTATQLDQLFVPFSGSFQEGTGLGMSLVYKFTEAMGWRVRVESELGVGTAVEISGPLGRNELVVASEDVQA